VNNVALGPSLHPPRGRGSGVELARTGNSIARCLDTPCGVKCAAGGWMRFGRKVEELGDVAEEGRLGNELDGGFNAFWGACA